MKTLAKEESEIWCPQATFQQLRFLMHTWYSSSLFDKYGHKPETGQSNIIKDQMTAL